MLGDLVGFARGLDPRGLEELPSFSEQGSAGLRRFLEPETGGFLACFAELLIQGGPALAFTIESLRRLRFLVDSSLNSPSSLANAFFGSRVRHHGGLNVRQTVSCPRVRTGCPGEWHCPTGPTIRSCPMTVGAPLPASTPTRWSRTLSAWPPRLGATHNRSWS